MAAAAQREAALQRKLQAEQLLASQEEQEESGETVLRKRVGKS